MRSLPGTLELDFRERDGFQIGKAAALADHAFRKDRRAFNVLCNQLRLKNWRSKNRERARAQDRAYRAARRKPLVMTCQNPACGATFTAKKRRTSNHTVKWCSRKCANAVNGQLRKPRNRGIRNRSIGPTILKILRSEPGLRLREIAARDAGLKRGSVASKLTEFVRLGRVVRDKGRYRLAPRPGLVRLPSRVS